MTTNQTIDGVPRLRELLERVATEANHMLGFTYSANYDECRAAVDELRALLDAPICEFHQSADECKAYSGRSPCSPAAQPQGEPVAWIAMAVGKDGEIYRKTTSSTEITLRDARFAWGQGVLDRFTIVTKPLYAEQPAPVAVVLPFQSRVQPWMLECFGEAIASDTQERNHRFLEEALELVQSNQCTADEAHQLVDYVYGRPVGEPSQEVGGVMVTLAALCLAAGLDMHAAGETELARIWTKVEQIRAKQAAKPAMSPLPGAYPDRETPTTMCDCNQGRIPCHGRCKP
ncbi:hypothetical protein [Pseudomonas sp.]|uniref:hypothetical protein n=1 Tax=Pseudomonas sp. TaxID=306 RepID=UPI003FD70F66